MKRLFIFSNPFGYGPAGKAISVAKYLNSKLDNTEIILCGSQHFSQITDRRIKFIKIDDRNENIIKTFLMAEKGEKYVFSSQNRFAVKAALRCNIPSSFLDGLAWFWSKIPEDHFLADIIFWLNYPKIVEKIPVQYNNKIHIIHGITEKIDARSSNQKHGMVMYIGGCKNPLTSLPYSYLDLIAKLFVSIDKKISIEVCTDYDSRTYLKNENISKFIRKYNHSEFVSKLALSEKFISNGGQTATLESFSVNTPIMFFLPINLSQFSLIDKLNLTSNKYPCLNWRNYVDIPKDIYKFSEKEVLELLETKSKEILKKQEIFKKLQSDFFKMISQKQLRVSKDGMFNHLGFNGSEDIYKILKNLWKLS